MYLAIGRCEKNSWGTKSSTSMDGIMAIMGRQKIVSTFFRHFSFVHCGGGKNQQGASNGNVTN